MAHDAFISYSTRDKAAADATCAALEAAGIRCWIAPRDVQPSAEWGEAIVQAINRCRVLVLIFSANANESPQIRREVERAVSKGIPVLPVRIENVAPAGSLEYFIGTIHWLDALTPPLESHLRQLGEAVKTLLQIDPAPPRIAPAPVVARSPLGRIVGVGVVLALIVLGASPIGLWRYRAGEPGPVATNAAGLASASTTIAASSAQSLTRPAPVSPTVAASPTPITPSPVAPTPAPPTVAASPASVASSPAPPTAVPPTVAASSAPIAPSATAPPAVAATPAPIAPSPTTTTTAPLRSPTLTRVVVDPQLVGTFVLDGGVDDYDQKSLYTISADGTYRLVTALTEDGVYKSGNGRYRTTAIKTGRVRAGSYRIVGDAAIEVTSATGSAVFRPEQLAAPLDRNNPMMIGVWRATVTLNGALWTLTIDNAPSGSYHYEARMEDTGTCAYADGRWRATSSVTGLNADGTYRVAGGGGVEFSGPAGSAVWRRQ